MSNRSSLQCDRVVTKLRITLCMPDFAATLPRQTAPVTIMLAGFADPCFSFEDHRDHGYSLVV